MLGDRQQGVPVYARIAALVEGVNIDIDSLILPDYPLGVVVRVEGIHQYKRYVGVVRLVEMLPENGNSSCVIVLQLRVIQQKNSPRLYNSTVEGKPRSVER